MSSKESKKVILFPDLEKIKEEVEQLSVELSMLVLERDELRYVTCKNIETRYMLVLGALEYRVYKSQCQALRLQRKMELIQARINHQETIILSQIEDLLDLEFEKYQAELNAKMAAMNEALLRNEGELLSEEETEELKKLYRIIVKALHPDLNPNVSEDQIQLFQNAVQAYKNGDLDTLRIIHEMVGEPEALGEEKDPLHQLLEEKARLEKRVEEVRKHIEEIKSSYPYIVKEIVEDEEKIRLRKEELEEILENNEAVIKIYKEKIKNILEGEHE